MNTKNVLKKAVVAMCLIVPFDGHADFLKELDKAAEELEKIAETLDPSGTNTRTTRYGSTYGIYPGITMQLQAIQRWGDGVMVVFSITNTSNQDINIIFDSNSKNCIHRDEFGNEAKGLFAKQDINVNVPADITVKRSYMLYNLDPTATVLSSLSITGRAKTAGSRYERFAYTARNMPISTTQNTNTRKATCSLPTIYLTYKGLERSGKDMVVNFSLENTSNSEIQNPYNKFNYVVYDADGNSYNCEIYRGNATAQTWFKSLPPGVPMNFHFVIKDVPYTVTGFRLIRIQFARNNQYKIEFKNITI